VGIVSLGQDTNNVVCVGNDSVTLVHAENLVGTGSVFLGHLIRSAFEADDLGPECLDDLAARSSDITEADNDHSLVADELDFPLRPCAFALYFLKKW